MKCWQVLVRNIQISTQCMRWQCGQFWRILIAYETKTKWQFRKLKEEKIKTTEKHPPHGLFADKKLENTNSGISRPYTLRKRGDQMRSKCCSGAYQHCRRYQSEWSAYSVNVRQATAIAPEPTYNYKNTSGELGNNTSLALHTCTSNKCIAWE